MSFGAYSSVGFAHQDNTYQRLFSIIRDLVYNPSYMFWKTGNGHKYMCKADALQAARWQ